MALRFGVTKRLWLDEGFGSLISTKPGCFSGAAPGVLALWQRMCHSTQTAAEEIEDTLKVAALIHSFRNDGHLAAALDPLHRVGQGPWLAESRQATTWYAMHAHGAVCSAVQACATCAHQTHCAGVIASLAQSCIACQRMPQSKWRPVHWLANWVWYCQLPTTGKAANFLCRRLFASHNRCFASANRFFVVLSNSDMA